MQQAPSGHLWLTIQDTDGNELVTGVPIQDLEPSPATAQAGYRKEFGERPAVELTWDDGSNFMAVWPVDSIDQVGPQTKLVGPKGVALLSRRNLEETNPQ